MTTLAELTTKVHHLTDVTDGTVTLLNGISAKLRDALAANDPAALNALADEIDADAAKLGAAVAANTPAPPAPAEATVAAAGTTVAVDPGPAASSSTEG